LITPADAEGMLTSGSADFVSLGRALVADAYWCAKAFGQVPTPIRACISCNVCFERLTRERDMSCVQNPLVGTEFEAPQFAEPRAARAAPHPASARAPRILILGAGVSGIEAARMLAGFGHTVEVWESSDQVGGQMPLALAAPFKDDVTAVWSYRWDQVRQLDVPVKIAAVATAQSIAAARPDHVIVATGSRPRKPLFEVPPPIRSLQAWDVLRTPAIIESGETLVIVGGGMVGIETADLLIGRGCRITVIEQTAVVAKEMAQNNRVDVLLRLAESDVALLTETMITGIENGSVLADTRGETRRLSGVDGLIWAIGPEPNRGIVPVLERLGIPHSLIGDCNQVGDFLSGIRDASLVALMLAERFRARGDIPKTSVAVADMGIESAYKF
jgi:NADPH-dependent 2,4-dienoyl-CoA reductase/sulfur reductase-like enzyme